MNGHANPSPPTRVETTFCDEAVRQGMIRREHAEKIERYSIDHDVTPSDAALTLSMMEPYEVDAIELLLRPHDLAPGFELTGLLGCGAAGMVFRARQTNLQRDVALKTINLHSRSASATGRARIQREAQAIARLHHPGIVSAYDSGFHSGRFCIAMELVEGETLATYIERTGASSESTSWEIIRQVAAALSHADQLGIIHRDIKPANLLLTTAPQGLGSPAGVPFVKVADFGLALLHDNDSEDLTATGTTLGTPAYVSPEQLLDTHVDARADIYSLGSTAFHMLTGKPPCAERSPMRTIMQKSIGDDRWRDALPASISAESAQLFRDMTETDPQNRIGSYDELLARLDQVIHGLKTSDGTTREPATHDWKADDAAVEAPSESASPIGLRRWMLLLILMVTGLGSITWMMRPNLDPPITENLSNWQPGGFPIPIFNGESVPLFRQTGSWTAETATDGSRVLLASEGSQMTIPLSDKRLESQHVRLRFGVNQSANAIAEIVILSGQQQTKIGSLRLTPQVAMLNGDDESSDSSVMLSLRDPQEVVFHQVQIYRLGEMIWIGIDGHVLGRIELVDESVFVQWQSIQGSTRFADVDLVSMERVSVTK